MGRRLRAGGIQKRSVIGKITLRGWNSLCKGKISWVEGKSEKEHDDFFTSLKGFLCVFSLIVYGDGVF